MAELRFHGPNAGYVLELYERFQRDPASVDEGWRAYLSSLSAADVQALESAAAPAAPSSAAAAASGVDLQKAFAARELGRAIRQRGHTAAKLDPLGADPPADPVLELSRYGLTEAELAQLPASSVFGHDPASANALAQIERLRAVYMGTVGYEWLH